MLGTLGPDHYPQVFPHSCVMHISSDFHRKTFTTKVAGSNIEKRVTSFMTDPLPGMIVFS